MTLRLPDGVRLAVSVGADFDAQSLWMGTFRSESPSLMSRGEFGAEVGVPRLLSTFRARGIRTTFFIPTHTMQTFPAAVESIVTDGHEIAAHGVYHEYVPKLEEDEERRLIELQIRLHEEHVGRRPVGYRSPAFDHSTSTMHLLEEYEFAWDSSLMGRDFEVYRPKFIESFDRERGNAFGRETSLLEFPVSWYLDDFPDLENHAASPSMQDTDVVLRRWIDSFDFAYERCSDGVVSLAVHPQTIGRAQNLLMLERFLDHVQSHEGVLFAPLSQLAGCWVE